MRLVFCGTPQFAVPTLESLIAAGHQIELVVTQPDRPRGRGLELAASPVRLCAGRHGLPIVQPEKIKNNAEFRARLESIAAEAIIVVGYGRIIPPWMLKLPPRGNINLHGSLLPKYRGAAPIQWAIAEGEQVSGVTTMLLNEGLDTGDVLLKRALPIGSDETAVEYGARLADVGSELMVETLRAMENGSVTPQLQDHSQATLAPILTKDDGRVDFAWTAQKIYNRFRGFQPWPGCYTEWRGKKFSLTQIRPAATDGGLPPSVLSVEGERLIAGCAENSAIELLEVQPEGKRRMSAADFVRGYRPASGDRLGG